MKVREQYFRNFKTILACNLMDIIHQTLIGLHQWRRKSCHYKLRILLLFDDQFQNVMIDPIIIRKFTFSYCVTKPKLWTLDKLSSTIFCCVSVFEASVTTDQISTFSIYTGTKALFWVTHSILGLVYNILGSILDNSFWINLPFVTVLSPLSFSTTPVVVRRHAQSLSSWK